MSKRILCYLAIACASLGTTALAQLPQTRLGALVPPGGQQGTTTEVRIVGEQDLEYDPTPRLILSHPGITAEPVADPTTGLWQNNTFKVTIGPEVPAGRHDAMLVGYYGASNPRTFRVEKIAALNESTDASPAVPTPLPLNTAFYGRLESAADVDVISFVGEAGQTVAIRCDATAIDSPLQSVLEVTGPDQRRIGFAGGAFVGETLLPLILPTAGEYRVQLTDAAYRGGADFSYRLEIATRPVIASVFPPAGQPGTSMDFSLLGYNLPGGEPVEGAAPLLRRNIRIDLPPDAASQPSLGLVGSYQAEVSGFDFQFSEGVADPVPVFFSMTPPEIEQDVDSAVEQALSIPKDIAGRFETPGDIDTYTFDAKAGEVYYIEVFAKRFGSSGDPLLTLDQITGPDGMPKERRLSSIDDQATNLAPKVFDTQNDDPVIRFDVPEDGRYRITLRDQYSVSRGDLSLFYLLSIRKPVPDFQLVAVPVWRDKADSPFQQSGLSLRKGESVTLPIYAFRRDAFNGPIQVDVENPTTGLSATPVTIGEGQTSALLVLTATADAPPSVAPLKVVGTAALLEAPGRPAGEVQREARVGTIVRSGAGQPTMSRIAASLMVSILDEAVPFRIADSGAAIRIGQGSQLLVPLQIDRREGYAEAVAIAATGLPQDSKVTVESKPFAPGETQQLTRLVIDPQAPPRNYPVAFTGTAKIDYGRFPLRLKRAKQSQETANQAFTQADEALKQFTAAREQAAQLVATTEAAAKTLAGTVDTTAALEAAKQTVASLDATAKIVEEARKQREAAKTAADAAAAEVEKIAAVQKLDYVTTAPPLSVTIVPAPADMTIAAPNEGQVKRGETIEVKITATRREGFTGPITLSLTLPPGVAGLSAEPIVIAPEQAEGTLRVTVAGDAPEGPVSYPAIRLVADHNGPVQIDRPVAFTVVP